MPAVIIRMIDALAAIGDLTTTPEQRRILLRQADAILRSAERSVSEPDDSADIRAHYERLVRKLAGTRGGDFGGAGCCRSVRAEPGRGCDRRAAHPGPRKRSAGPGRLGRLFSQKARVAANLHR